MLSMRRVGLDVHARETTAVLLDVVSGELRVQRIAGRPEQVLAWLETLEQPFRAVYEAGPTGYGLARRAAERGLDVVVCSPGHIRKHPGDRIKTDRRDAERLARLLVANELKLVRVPEPAEEQLRDLVRAREDLRVDLMRCRHRISKFLLRRELYYPHPGNAWTGRHRDWLTSLRFDDEASELTFVDMLHAHDSMLGRRERLERALAELAERWDESSFVEEMERRWGEVESGVTREIIDWSRTHFTRLTWGKGPAEGGFSPAFDHDGRSYWPFWISTNGRLRIQFQWMEGMPPFDQDSKKLELVRKLNEIPDVDLPADSISKRPAILLTTLAAPGSLQTFFIAVEWFLAEAASASP